MANKRLNTTITIGGSITSGLKSAFSSTEKHLTSLGRGVTRLSKEQRLLGNSIQTFGKLGKNVDGLRAKYASVTKELERLRKAQDRALRLNNARTANISRRGELRGQMFDTVALGAAAAGPVLMAVSFETAMLGVAKQLDGARDASGKLTKKYYDMAAGIQQLGRELPVSTNAIAEMVAAGLRMGVASDEVLDFVRATSQMSTAFELPEGELAENMGKIANLYKIPIPRITELADTINYLDDNAISKGGDIIDFLQRTGGVAGAVKITGKEMAALGSTLLTLGESSETSSTSVNAMFARLAAATKGTKQFKEAIGEIGLSLTKVQSGMQTDAMGTMQKVFEAISKRNPKDHLGLLVQLFGREHAPKLVKLVTGVGELHRQLELANGEAAKGSMGREFAARMETTAAQATIAKNRLAELAVNLGSVLLPTLNSLMGTLGPVVSKTATWATENPKLTKVIVGTVTALVGLKVATLAGAYAFTFLKGGVLNTLLVFNRLRTALPLVGRGIALIGRALLLNPIGLTVTAIAGAAYLIYKNWEPIKGFFTRLWDEPKKTLGEVWEWFKSTLSWTPLAMVANNWEPIKGFFTRLWADILSVFNNTIGKIQGAITSVSTAWGDAKAKVGGAWQSTKSFFSLGGDDTPSADNTVPAAAAAGRAGNTNYTDNSQVTLQISQKPGESQEALAQRIMRELEKRKQVNQRSMMVDPVGAN